MRAPIVYFLPGLLCDSFVWKHQVAALGGGFDIRALDFLDGNTLRETAEKLLADAPEQFAVVGHSMGGRVALELIGLASQRITGVALLDTGVHPARPHESDSRGALVDLAFAEGMEAVARQWLPPMLHPDRLQDPDIMADLTSMVCRATPELFRKQQNALLSRPDGQPRLGVIEGPCAIIVGRQDRWSPPAQHEKMAELVRGATLTIIEDCGHMSTVERPQAVTGALQDWLRML